MNARARLPPSDGANAKSKAGREEEPGRGYGRPLIDYDAALCLAPLEMAGAVLGATAQRMLPDWLLLGAASAVLAATGRRTLGRYAAMRGAERSETGKVEKSSPGVEKTSFEEGSSGSVATEGSSSGEEDIEENCEASGSYKSLEDDEDDELRRGLLEADARQYPAEKIAALALLWTGLASVTLLRGSDHFACGDAGYCALLAAQFAWTLGFAAFHGQKVVESTGRKVEAGYPFRDTDVLWDHAALRLYGAWTLVAGVVAGLVGIGGGMVLGPLMLAMGVDPRVSTATTGSECPRLCVSLSSLLF